MPPPPRGLSSTLLLLPREHPSKTESAVLLAGALSVKSSRSQGTREFRQVPLHPRRPLHRRGTSRPRRLHPLLSLLRLLQGPSTIASISAVPFVFFLYGRSSSPSVIPELDLLHQPTLCEHDHLPRMVLLLFACYSRSTVAARGAPPRNPVVGEESVHFPLHAWYEWVRPVA